MEDTGRCSKKPDHSQIPLRRKDLRNEVRELDMSIGMNLLYCIYYGPEHPEYKIRLMAASLMGEYIARFVYKGKDGCYRKLPRKFYERWLFLNYCESIGEVQDRLAKAGRIIPEEEAEEILEKYLRIKELLVQAITFFDETPFASELAYGADYVITHEALPMPEFDGSMFPKNYPGYDCGSGIGEEFFGDQMGC